MGALPRHAEVSCLHNPVLAVEVGDEFLAAMRRPPRESSDRSSSSSKAPSQRAGLGGEGYWAALGTDPVTGEPMTTCAWVDQLAGKAPKRSSRSARARRTAGYPR